MQEDANTLQQEDEILMPENLDKSNTVEADGDSSTPSEDNHEEKSNSFQDRINKVTADKYTEQRRADDLQKQLDALQSSQTAQAPEAKTEESLVAPTLPEDIFDEEAMRKYHSETSDYNQKVANQAAIDALNNQRTGEQKQQQQQKQQEVINRFAQNALRDGVNPEKLRAAEQTVVNAGIDNTLANHIMNDPNGGKIVEFLHDNPAMLHELVALDPISAGMKIAADIKPAVVSASSNVSNAPAPQTEIRGGGVHEQDEFDRNYPGVEFI